MRTVHSILDRTDRRHLSEIILVNDYSDIEDLEKKVNNAVLEINEKIEKEEDMLEANNNENMDNSLVDYINDDGPKSESLQILRSGFSIQLLNTSKREGLIRARLHGAENAIGDVSNNFYLLCVINYVEAAIV